MTNILSTVPQEIIDQFWSTVKVTPIDSHWQERMGWSSNLKGMSIRSLDQFKAAPTKYFERNPEQPDSLYVIWNTMLSVAETSQHIVSRTELAIRAEAARIDPASLSTSLESDIKVSIEEQVRPWQEILAVIWRAEDPDEYGIKMENAKWYDLSPRQHECLDRPYALASEPQTLDLFGAKRAARREKFEFSPLESACLAFYLSLLNQRALDDVKECAMVQVLAVLGWEDKGWATPEQYMVTLSRLIQTARWMVVGRSLELANDGNVFIRKWCTRTYPLWMVEDPLDDAEFDRGICVWKSEKKGHSFLRWVEIITQAFMTERIIGPMQWMLQLRADSLQVMRTLVDSAEQWDEFRD